MQKKQPSHVYPVWYHNETLVTPNFQTYIWIKIFSNGYHDDQMLIDKSIKFRQNLCTSLVIVIYILYKYMTKSNFLTKNFHSFAENINIKNIIIFNKTSSQNTPNFFTSKTGVKKKEALEALFCKLQSRKK